MKYKFLTIPFVILFFYSVPSTADLCKSSCGIAPELKYNGPYTLLSPKNLLKDYPSKDSFGNVQAVIEIPAGRTEKWEVDKEDGDLKWNFKKGKPRV